MCMEVNPNEMPTEQVVKNSPHQRRAEIKNDEEKKKLVDLPPEGARVR